jgi:hypothetical protein
MGGKMMETKADEIALKTGTDFTCSNGWLQQFKGRLNIMWKSVSREGASADVDLAQK